MRRHAEGPQDGAALIAAERKRQIRRNGYTTKGDAATWTNDELARAAATYAMPDRHRDLDLFPWDEDLFWKPTPDDRIRELAKAGALIAAEIDRLQHVAQDGDS